MRYLLYSFGALSILIFMISCDDAGHIMEYSEDGSLYRDYYVDDDSLNHGKYLVYYEGKNEVFEEANYVHGVLEGKRTLYFENGNPEIEETYKNDKMVDTLKVYYPNGTIQRKMSYVDGVLSGSVLSYFKTGTLKEFATVEDNLENGPFKEYHPNGKLKWEGQFLNGDKEFGELTNYDSTGLMIRKMWCDSQAVCKTTWTIEKGEI